MGALKGREGALKGREGALREQGYLRMLNNVQGAVKPEHFAQCPLAQGGCPACVQARKEGLHARFLEFDGEGSGLTGQALPAAMGTDLRQGPGDLGRQGRDGEDGENCRDPEGYWNVFSVARMARPLLWKPGWTNV